MTPRPRRTLLGAVSLSLVLGLALSGCSTDRAAGADSAAGGNSRPASPTPAPTPPPGPDDVQYVALGDSYAAAPGVPETDPAGGCFRSDSNYAHVLAEAQDLYLTDATCSGADSDRIIAEQVPQLGAGTDVVTVGTGGNDFDLFATVLRGCLARPGSSEDPTDPAVASGPTCSDVVRTQVEPLAQQIQAKMGQVLDAVLQAAPNAEVYVVGYPTLVPETGTCPDLLPLAAEDYPLMAGITQALSESLRLEATERDLPYVDVFSASLGHDICASDPWVNGARLGADGTAPFHPFADEQAAIAALVGDLR